MSEKLNFNYIANLSKKVSFIMLCITVSYITVLGTATFFGYGPVSLWRVLVGLTCVSALPVVFKYIKEIVKSPFLYILIGFALWLLVSAFIGYKNGNVSALITRDFKCFLYLALYPVIKAVLREKRQINILLKCIMYSSFVLSIFTCVFMGIYLFLPKVNVILVREFWKYAFINYTPISKTIPRVLFVSTPFIIIGCAVSCYFQTKSEKFSAVYPIITGLGLFSILITYTRSLYLATFIAAVIVVTMLILTSSALTRKNIIKHLVCSVLVLVVAVAGFSVAARTNYFGYAVSRVFATGGDSNVYTDASGETSDPEIPDFDDEESYLEATKVSDQIRVNLKKNLKDAIKKSPIIGNGLGLSIGGRQSLPELFYLDLFAKTGIIGLLLFLAPAVLALFIAVRSFIRRRYFAEHYVYLSGIAGLLLYALYQPYMNNAPCMVMYCLLFAIAETKYANKPKHTLLDR